MIQATNIKKISFFLSICLSSLVAFSAHAASSQVYMEDMTWMEIRERIQSGVNTAIIPVGGTEQNGPHMVTGKHNTIVHYTAGEIAKRMGNMLVAPVITYGMGGRITPPEGHMKFPGTISVRDDTFMALLEDAAASLKQHGFKTIYIIGDHGGTQDAQAKVAERLSASWASNGVRVIHLSDYYAKNGQEQYAETIGARSPNPGGHAALIDTSELMAIESSGIRNNLRGRHSEADFAATGATGDSSQASADYGRHFLSLKIEAAVNQINRGR